MLLNFNSIICDLPNFFFFFFLKDPPPTEFSPLPPPPPSPSRGVGPPPPLPVKPPDAAGYGAIPEAAVIHFAGMVLQADGQGAFRARLGHAPPASYPFTLRYGDAEAARLAQPAAISDTITTPWRVVMIGPDLNTLVNCDIVSNP